MAEQRSNMLALQRGLLSINVRICHSYMTFFHSLSLNSLAVKLIASFLLSYPLAGVLKRIPDAKPYQKNSFIIAYATVSGPRYRL